MGKPRAVSRGERKKQEAAKWRPFSRRFALAVAGRLHDLEWNGSDLGRACRLSRPQVTRILDGDTPFMSAAHVLSVCKVLKLDPLQAWFGSADLPGSDEPDAAPPSQPEANGSNPPSA